MTDVKPLPEVGSFWRHKGSRRVYCVEMITNTQAVKPGWPVTVVYQDDDRGMWSRPATEWHDKFEPAGPDDTEG